MANIFARAALMVGAATLLVGATKAPVSRHVPAPVDGRDWYSFGGNDDGQHYSPLGQINTDNVAQLGLAWSYDIDTFDAYTQPLEVGGVVYFAVGHSVIHALDARSGRLLWQYDPKVAEAPEAQWRMRAGWGIRGIAFRDGKVITATRDGRLLAVDARSGKLAWSVQTLDEPGSEGAYITGPPFVAGGVVVIGFGGADYSRVRGYVSGYDLKTGKKAWRWYVVPGNPAVDKDETTLTAARTWTGEWWKFGGGGAVYHGMTYDAKYDRIYLGTGNGFPWNQKIRSPGGGDNLYLASIVALDAKTGKYVWHYQTNPGITWDFNNAMDIELTDMVIDGQKRPVLLHAPKNGFYYVIDRESGKLLSAEKFASVNWADKIDMATGRPVENPEAHYPGGKPFVLYPFPNGAHGVQAMAHSPQTGLTYIPVMEGGRVHIDPANIQDWKVRDGMFVNTGLGAAPASIVVPPAKSMLVAWDPAKQQKTWSIPQPGTFNGGVLATGGKLIFQGLNTGDFAAYAADSGMKLWSFDAQNGILSAPISYSVGGRQYVSVIASFRSSFPNSPNWDYRQQRRRVLTFAIGGKRRLPAFERVAEPVLDDPEFKIDAAKAAVGAGIYNIGCNICHGGGMMAGGAAPDLRKSAVPLDADSFNAVVREGALMQRGMGKFAHLTDAEVEGLRHYIRQRARETMPKN
jgi:quinohemoprotein ethanol dehydrogenase